VVVPPSVTAAPTNQAVVAGNDAPFSVTAAGTSPLFYQWYFNGANIPGATSNVFTVAGAQPANAGAYTVSVTNMAGGITSSAANLNVLIPASITAQPASQTVISGSNATFAVAATGSAPLTYQWKFNGTNLAGKTTASLTVSHARTEDAGQY